MCPFCSKFHKTLECVHMSTKNCSEAVKESFSSSLVQARNMLGNSCPLLSSVMCNMARWETTLSYSRCEPTKANQCMLDLESYSRANMTKMDGMCM